MQLETTELLFKIANGVAIVAWVTMGVLYDHKLTKKIIFNGIITALSIFYFTLVCMSWSNLSGGNALTLGSTMALFSNPIIMLLGWVHYLAFDMLVGLLIIRSASTQGFHRLLVLPMLLFTFLYGPVGLLMYLVALMVKQKTVFPSLL